MEYGVRQLADALELGSKLPRRKAQASLRTPNALLRFFKGLPVPTWPSPIDSGASLVMSKPDSHEEQRSEVKDLGIPTPGSCCCRISGCARLFRILGGSEAQLKR